MNLLRKRKPHFIVVCSGKGGVGKSTVSCALGKAFSKSGKKTLLLDCDVRGPSISIMLGVKDQCVSARNNKLTFVPLTDTLDMASIVNISSVSTDTAIGWKAVQSSMFVLGLIEEAAGQDYEYIILDTEASSGEIMTDILEYIDEQGLKISAVVVTDAGEPAIMRTRRMIDFLFSKTTYVVGCILNFAGISDTGMYFKMLHDFNVRHLGAIEFDAVIKVQNDCGTLDIGSNGAVTETVRQVLGQ